MLPLETAFHKYFIQGGPTQASFFAYFCIFVQKIILVVSRIRTRIVGVEGKDADH